MTKLAVFLEECRGISKDFEEFPEFQVISKNFEGFRGISRDFERLRGISRDLNGLCGVAWDYRGFQRILRDFNILFGYIFQFFEVLKPI